MTANRSTIQGKLMTAIMGTSLLVLLLTCTAFVTFEIVSVRRGLVRGMTTRVELIAANSSAALAFQNTADATEVLAALGKDSHILAASLYDNDGHLFAMYPKNAPAGMFPAGPPPIGHKFGWNEIAVTGQVIKGGRAYGVVYLSSDLDVLKDRIKVYAMLSLIVMTCSILLTYGLSIWLQKRISAPILILADAARGVSERKDYSVRPIKVSDDELGLLTESFNEMLGEIQQRETSLRASEARMRAILESALDAIVTMDQAGLIVEFNPAAEDLFQYKREEAIGKLLSDLIIPPGLRGRHRQGLKLYLETGENIVLGKRLEMTAMKSDGTEFPVELGITRIVYDGPPMFTGFIRDITARKQAEREIQQLNAELEERVEERTRQLAASNKELEAFSYSVSHDLRAPLRGIDGFTKVILEDHAQGLNPEGRRYLERVRNAAQRMSQLIDNLLNLSRLGRMEMRQELIDLTAMADRMAEELKQSQPARKVDFVIERGLTARGDSTLLQMVMDNLLNNAWKYTSKHETARIEFGRMVKEEPSVFFVRDDGAGFDMAHADMLFAPFQRLHRQTDFEGTGVGLATVQRIIARHGGRIWAEAEVEKGATFYFLLPNA